MTPRGAKFPRALGGGPLLRFRYTNWRGEDHEYVVEPESVELGYYDPGGIHPADHPDSKLAWVLHGMVVTRDGDARPDMGASRRRTFMIEGIREPKEAERDG